VSSVTRKVVIVAAVVVLLIAAYFVSNLHNQRRYVNTFNKIVLLGSVIPNTKPGSTSDISAPPHIWLIGSEGKGAVELTSGKETDADPSFSPDGSTITFISDRKGTPQVWLINADKTQAGQLTSVNGAKSLPKFSPDGKTIAYINAGRLYLVRVDTKSQDVLFPVPQQSDAAAGGDSSGPSNAPVKDFNWQPGITHKYPVIAAIQSTDDGHQLLSLVGGELQAPIQIAVADNISCTWAPDGSVLYVSLVNCDGAKLPDNGNAQNAAGAPPLAPLPSKWPKSAIYRFGPDGAMLNLPPLAPAAPSSHIGTQHPTVSPDGAVLAFEVWDVQNSSLSTMKSISSVNTSDGSNGPIVLNIKGKTQLLSPSYRPDGGGFAFLGPDRLHKGVHDVVFLRTSPKTVIDVTWKGNIDVQQYQFSPATAGN